jgi:peptidoglycan/LPS O-acetylase OafA/YrhL
MVLIILLSQKEYSFFVNRFTAFLGKISFSMYVIHFAGIYIMIRLGVMDLVKGDVERSAVINVFIRFLLLISITAIASTISYYTIELPFQRLGQKLITRLKNKRAARLIS